MWEWGSVSWAEWLGWGWVGHLDCGRRSKSSKIGDEHSSGQEKSMFSGERALWWVVACSEPSVLPRVRLG